MKRYYGFSALLGGLMIASILIASWSHAAQQTIAALGVTTSPADLRNKANVELLKARDNFVELYTADTNNKAAALAGDCTVGPCLDGTSDGGNIIKLWAGTGSYWTALQGGAPAANRSWRLPIAAAPVAGATQVMTMDQYGQMAFLGLPDVSGKVISSTTAGVLSWAAGGGTDTDDQTAAEVAFTPYSTLAATNMQTAIQELLDEGGGSVDVSDTAYDATSWNGVTGVAPSKNAVRDVLESLPTLTFSTGLTNTSGTITVTTNTYQPIDADLTDLADGSLSASKVGNGFYVADDCATVTTPATGAVCFEY